MTATKLLKRNTSLYIQINVICDLYGDKRMRDAKARLGSDVDWLGFMAAFNRGILACDKSGRNAKTRRRM